MEDEDKLKATLDEYSERIYAQEKESEAL